MGLAYFCRLFFLHTRPNYDGGNDVIIYFLGVIPNFLPCVIYKFKGIEFFLTATILTNKNEIFNDDQYEYDQLGIPFLAALGREMYEFEKNQQRAKWLKATLKN